MMEAAGTSAPAWQRAGASRMQGVPSTWVLLLGRWHRALWDSCTTSGQF